MEYVEVRVFRPVGSIPAFRLMVFAASTVFGVKIAVASPDAAGVESPEAVDSVDSALLSEAVLLSVDAVELELYNGMLSGLSLSGDAFFYENPLEIHLDNYKKAGGRYPITQRQKIFVLVFSST